MNLKELNIELTFEQQELFRKYYEFLIQENKKYNLTAITNEEEVYYKHFYDSLTLIKTNLIKEGVSLCDIGSGAGFPGMPLKIIYPNLKLTIVESQTKKTEFLKKLVNFLELDNVEIINKRAEEYAHTKYFDIVTARAVADLSILNELCLPLVKKGGYFIAMKGNYEEELKRTLNGITILGGKLIEVLSFELPKDMGKRNLIIIKKEKMVQGYPRAFSQIKKKPL
ncbi:MAG: 16S rRNA (guanine(527)-N(7))-methyltransferase RsmG [Acholeplasmataceae bacterium]|nr:16S rRNA (guanine(527)-N(7))-methyltransferase RsmG [Acholeplasmataceae bacterium]